MKFAIAIILLIQGVFSALNPACLLCHDIVRLLGKSVPSRSIQTVVDYVAVAYCKDKHLQDAKVCRGAVREMVPVILGSVWAHYADPHLVCSKLRLCSRQYTPRSLQADITRILAGKPEKQWEKPSLKKKLKVVHISDLHVDLFYTFGAPSKCTEPVCCRSNSTAKLNPWNILSNHNNGASLVDNSTNDNPADYWGSLNDCDLPIQTLDLFLKELEKIDADLIIWTGDNTPHDVWQQSQSYNLNFTTLISERLSRHTKAIVIPTMGNHESFPVNVYDYEGQREAILNRGLAEAWRSWLTPSAFEMLRTKGYFSLELPNMNNLKILSVNTQAFNNENWILLRNPTDPGKMLQWIEDELKASQKIGQIVWIIGHIPPLSALNDWGMRFNALTQRYSYILRAQYYGHRHTDHIGIFLDNKNRKDIVGYCFVAPSLQCGKNPQYRVLDVDFESFQVLDYNQFSLNLTKFTKKQDPAKFQLLYSFKDAYNLADMTLTGGISQFHTQLKDSQAIQKKYSSFWRGTNDIGKSGREVYCDVMTSQSYAAICNGGTYKPSPFQRAAGGWKDLKHNS